MSPKRIQRKRSRGWRMPEGAIYVGRPTKWGNEFAIGEIATLDIGGNVHSFEIQSREQAVNLFGTWQADTLRYAAARELRGHDLACWCPLADKDGRPIPCHADILLRLANEDTP